jgi:uncharacterized protein YbjT (DUF2867 family)
MQEEKKIRCLVTGATGYIGGRLVPELLSAGFAVRVMSRSRSKLRDVSWAGDVEIAEADARNHDHVTQALQDVDVAYYLIHALGSGASFAETDRQTARTFAAAARETGVGRLVYLGGLFPQDGELSPHLRSRAEVGDILLSSGVPTAVLNAAVILGSGSASFEMLRYLTERLPVMITPTWISTRIQPIAITDVLRYLVGCATLPSTVCRAFDIGGPDVLTYEEMMQRYAAVAGLRRRIVIKTPVLSPSLSSHWVGLVTPVPGSIARPLVESLRNEVVVSDRDIAAHIPDPPEGLLGFDRAVRLALSRIRDLQVTTHWSTASMAGAPSNQLPTDPDWAGGSLYVDERFSVVNASKETLWRVIEGIGGENGWYSWPLAWRVRGLVDRLQGGPGLRRGRRHPYDLQIGDALDWWRVEEVDDVKLLRLRAEMRLPGLAWLELSVGEDGQGRTVFSQRALYHPVGLLGHLYWWSVTPFHGVVFGGMQRNIARTAERLEAKVADPEHADIATMKTVARSGNARRPSGSFDP